MPNLEITVTGLVQPLAVRKIIWLRSLGCPVGFQIEISLTEPRIGYHDLMQALTGVILARVCTAQISLDGSSLGSELSITEFAHSRAGGQTFLLSGFFTDMYSGIHTPRRRVLHGSTMQELLTMAPAFRNWLCTEHGIDDDLSGFDTRHERTKPCYLIQDSVSDLVFIQRLVRAYNFCPQTAANRRIMLTGCEKEKKLKLIYADSNRMIQGQNIKEINSNDMQPVAIYPVSARGKALEDTHAHTVPRAVAYKFIRQIPSAGEWNDWVKAILPVKYGTLYATEVVDTLEWDGENLTWYTELVFRQQDYIADALDLGGSFGWAGLGIVSRREDADPWVSVQLTGFEDQYDTMEVRLSTPYSGDGLNGFHLVPEGRSEVYIIKPNDWLTPALYAGNMRSIHSVQVSPSWIMTIPMEWTMTDLKIGLNKLETASKTISSKSEKHSIESTQEITISVDDSKLSIHSTEIEAKSSDLKLKADQSIDISTQGTKVSIDNNKMSVT